VITRAQRDGRLIVRRGLADVLEWLGEEVVPGHTCHPPFWRSDGHASEDGGWQWICPTCLQRWRWTTTFGAVPGVPAEVCTWQSNKWVRA
jgi:hypothetical protein